MEGAAYILDIDCGKGFSTRLLAQHTQVQIQVVDNEHAKFKRYRRYEA